MGLRGPQPKSAEMRVLEGERAHRPLPAPRAAIGFGIPERPKRMTAAVGRFWDSYIEQLSQLGRGIPSATVLKRLCDDAAYLEELQTGLRKKAADLKRELKADGKRVSGNGVIEFVMTHEGRRAIQTINALATRILKVESDFGLNPRSASRFEDAVVLPPGVVGSAHQEMPGIEAALCG